MRFVLFLLDLGRLRLVRNLFVFVWFVGKGIGCGCGFEKEKI